MVPTRWKVCTAHPRFAGGLRNADRSNGTFLLTVWLAGVVRLIHGRGKAWPDEHGKADTPTCLNPATLLGYNSTVDGIFTASPLLGIITVIFTARRARPKLVDRLGDVVVVLALGTSMCRFIRAWLATALKNSLTNCVSNVPILPAGRCSCWS